MTFPKEFKEALSHLPSKEKDKLILRLLKKDITLANRLMFELVNTNTVDEQRNKIKKSILFRAKKTADEFYSIGWLNMDVRYLGGNITNHVKVTRDKFGEAHLNLVMINAVLLHNKQNILNTKFNVKTRKFCRAVIARVYKILIWISKLDQDYFIEFTEDLQTLGKHISENNYLMQTAVNTQFDVNWLLNTDIPEDIVAIHKQVRAMRLL